MTDFATTPRVQGLDVILDYCDVDDSRQEPRDRLCSGLEFDRFARSTRHLLTALEEFDHLGVRFVSVQDQVDTESPMGRAMFTIIGAMAELESSLISERFTAGMRAADARQWRGASSARSRSWPIRPTSASVKFRRKSQVKQAVALSDRSPNVYAPHRRLPCDHFLHVSSTYPDRCPVLRSRPAHSQSVGLGERSSGRLLCHVGRSLLGGPFFSGCFW
jgi:hypothetical protein